MATPARVIVKRVLLALLAVIVLTPPLVLLYFMYLFDWNRARDPLSTAASDKAGRKIVIEGDLRPHWGWPISRLSVGGLAVGNVEGGTAPNMLELEQLEAAVNVRSLFKGELEFTELTLTKPRLVLEKTADGDANWKFTDNPAGGVAMALLPENRDEFPTIGHLSIADGQVSYRDPAKKTDLSVRAATVAGKADDDDGRIHFDGKGLLQGQPFRFELSGGSLLQLRESDAPYPLVADFTSGETSAHVSGTVKDPISFKGMSVDLVLRGSNAADLFPITGIALLPTPPYEVKGRLDHSDDVWDFRKFAGRMGDSDLSGDLRWDQRPKRPLLTASFTSKKLDLDDLGGFIGARPGTGAGETASAEQEVQAAEDKSDPRVLPDIQLDISRLKAMDAEVEFRGVRIVATELPVDDFYAKFDLKDSVLKVEPVRFGTGRGDVAMWLTINGRAEPVKVTSRLEVRKVPIAAMFEGAADKLGKENLAQGQIGGTADLVGTGTSLRDVLATSNGTLGIGMEGGQLSQLIIELLGLDVAESVGYLIAGDKPVPIRCVIADFQVNDGLMQPRALVIDTDDTVVTGEGEINLDDESLNLDLKPEPKDFSPLSLRVPLEIEGTLKDPEFHVKPAGLIARGAVAAALLAVFPPAAIIAFIEPGLGEDSQCGQMLADMAEQSKDPKKNERLVPENKTVSQTAAPESKKPAQATVPEIKKSAQSARSEPANAKTAEPKVAAGQPVAEGKAAR